MRNLLRVTRVNGLMRQLARTLLLAALVAACGGAAATPGPTVIPGPSGGPTGGPALDAGQLRLLVMDRLGERWYCDPDEYPIAHGTELERAIERWDEMVAEGVVFKAVAAKLGINVGGAVTDAQKQAIYHIWKNAMSIPMDPVGDGLYRFDYTAMPVAGNAMGVRTAGLIDAAGTMTIESQAPAGEPNCPICLARGQRVDTPSGSIAVDALHLGDQIWTIDAAGRRVAGTVIALGSTEAPAGHVVIHLTLADGRSVTASPGHPLADGRQLGTLALGDMVDGSPIVGLETLPYGGGATFDLVASGATGWYYVDGVPLGTTLRPAS
jgi:hypothetical protein